MSPIAVSIKTAAQMVEVSESTIREAVNSNELPAFRVGRMIRVRVSDLEAWTDSRVAVGSEDDR